MNRFPGSAGCPGRRPMRLLAALALVAGLALVVTWLLTASPPGAAGRAAPERPGFGPHVYVFSPDMPLRHIESVVNSIARQQAGNQFGPQRYALLFKPGTYGSAAKPLYLQIGYYTSIAGLGGSPADVVINGTVDSFNQCFAPASPGTSNCTALDNFWRSLSNLTINVPAVRSGAPCHQTAEFWATSQAAPLRRVDINGFTSLMDYCSKPGYSSGGFIADSKFTGQGCPQRHSAAVPGQEQRDRWLEQRRLEPGLLRCHGRARAELRLRRTVHDPRS